jgi:16S rRNA (cytosine967-C5)-methyltransferase
VRRAGLARAVAFTNAVLRRLADGLRPLLDALPEATPAEAALTHSYPDWVAETWWRDFGADGARALMRAENEPRPTVVRVTRRGEGRVAGEPHADVPGALHVDRVDERALADGLLFPQSVGSQLAGLAVGPGPEERVLDCCAAPGAKTIQLAERAAEVVAVELHDGRARELEATLARVRARNIQIIHADARSLPAELADFDRALVDAPCSGLGVLHARPDLRWRARPLPDLQLELLRAAAERVSPGGTVVYAVCTLNSDEGEGVVDASGLAVDPSLGDEWPQFRHPRRPEFLLTLPHVHRTSGFFVARVRV